MARSPFAALAAALVVAGCSPGGEGSSDPFAGFGPNPPLPAPHKRLIPTIGIPKVVGWRPGEAPQAPAGFVVTRYAQGLAHPRWLDVLPNGDVLVAESASEPSKADLRGVRGFFAKHLMKSAGADEKSPNQIILLRGLTRSGAAEMQTTFARGLNRPFGMALVGDRLFVADDDGVVSLPYRTGALRADGAPEPVFPLPGGPINHHWTKSLIASPDGRALYATVGSNSNVGENGMAAEKGRAAIWRYDLATRQARIYASGLRNPNGLGFAPASGALWTAVNERDEIGNDLPPDYMTRVVDGGFYGWPYSYWGQHVDTRVNPPRPDLVARALKPDYGLGAHTASLGLAFYTAQAFPPAFRGGAFIGQHGSWNRKPLAGYRVVFIPFAAGQPSGQPEVFLSGFLDGKNYIRGRPVGVAVDSRGALLVADDVGGVIWRVAPAAS